MPGPVYASFNQGLVPTITLINKATVSLGVDFDALIAALKIFVDRDFAPVWGTPATLIKTSDTFSGAWAMVFLDDADAAGALGYHDLTRDGLPIAKVFVKTTIQAGDKVSVTACHELAEMLVDPAVNLWAMMPRGIFMALEMSDPCEQEEYLINGIAMSDFVHPAYFEGFRAPGSAKFDHLGLIGRPFQVLPGGYAIIDRRGRETEVFGDEAVLQDRADGLTLAFGSEEKAERFAAEDRRQHRSEFRSAGL